MGKGTQRTGEGTLRTCAKGHTFRKSGDCPTCPRCEAEKKPKDGFLSLLSAPARRALESKGIKTLKELSMYSKTELLGLHGFGPASMPVLEKILKDGGYNFK